MMICAEFHSHVSLEPKPPTSYLSFTQAKHLKKCTDFNTKFLFSDIFPGVTILVIFLNSNNLSVLSSFSTYVQTHFSSRREYLDLVSWRSIPWKERNKDWDLLDRSVGGRVRRGVAHHLVPLLRVGRVVRGHVVLLAGVGTVGVAVALGLGRSHRPLQVGRLVLRQCGLPPETWRPSSVGPGQTLPASARGEQILKISLGRNVKLSSEHSCLANTNIFF